LRGKETNEFMQSTISNAPHSTRINGLQIIYENLNVTHVYKLFNRHLTKLLTLIDKYYMNLTSTYSFLNTFV
jgi:hypothetical protein